MLVMTWAGERLAPLWTALGTLALAAAAWGAPGGVVLAALGVVCLAIACRVPGEGLRLVGPIAGYELARATRKRRVILWRALAGGWLLFVLWQTFPKTSGFSTATDAAVVAAFAERAAQMCLFALWVALPPALVVLAAPLLAEERGLLRPVLVTDLRGRELVFGRLLAALAEAGSLVLLAVPFLAVLPLFGGVEPAARACALCLLCSTALTLAGLAAWCGARSRTPAAALRGTATVALGYVAVTSIAWAQLPWLATSPGRVLAAANPFAAAWPAASLASGTDAASAWRLARPTLAAHVVLFLALSAGTAGRLRELAVSAGRARQGRRSPVPAAAPLAWRERRLIRPACPAWTLVAGAVLVCAARFDVRVAPLQAVSTATFAALSLHLLFLCRAVAVRFDADAKTEMWDLVRLTRLSGREIVAQKGRAAWLGGRRDFLIAVSVLWLAAACLGVLAWWAVPSLFLLTYAAQAGAVGLGLRLGVLLGPSGRAARSAAALWAAFALAPFVLAPATSGLSMYAHPAGGVLVVAMPPRGVPYDEIRQRRWRIVAHGVAALAILPAMWWLRRRAAASVRPCLCLNTDEE